MKGQVKTKFISILLIIFILADMFSPYSILLNRSYAASEANSLSVKPSVVLQRTSEIKTATNTAGDEVRYFEAEIGFIGDKSASDGGWVSAVTQINLQYNTSKLALVNQSTYDAINPATLLYASSGRGDKVTNYLKNIVNDDTGYVSLVYGETQTRLNSVAEGTISIEGETTGSVDPVYYSQEVGTTYNGAPYMPFVTMKFVIKDDSINLDNLTQDLITLIPTDGTEGTGMMITYYDNYDLSEAQDLSQLKYITGEYFTKAGFVTAENVKNVQSVAVTTTPTKVAYEHGDSIELEGGEITITYTDGTYDTVDMSTSSDISLDKTEVSVGDTKVTGTFTKDSITYLIEYPITVTDPVASIEVTSQPTRQEYQQGETIELAGAVITPTTKSGAVLDSISLPNVNVTVSETTADVNSVNFEKTGTTTEGLDKGRQRISLTYQGVTKEIDIMVNDTVKEITVQNPKTAYEWGDELDKSQGQVIVKTTSGSTLSPVPFSNGSVTITGYDKTNATTQTLTVSYLGKTTTYSVKVTDPVVAIVVDPLPQSTYNPEEELNLTGSYVYEVRKSTSRISKANLTADMISGYDNTKTGTQTLTVSYKGKTTTFDVTVLDTVKSLEITGMKTNYKYKDSLDITGATVTPVLYSGSKGTSVALTQSMIVSTFNSNVIGDQDITIEYDGVQTVVTVNVADVVSSISVKTEPKTRYAYGENLDVSNGVITVNWASGAASTEEEITASMVKESDGSNFNSNVTFPDGQTTVTKPLTIHYGGETTTYNVKIVNEITGISIKTAPKQEYNVNDTLDVSNGEITITRQVGTEDKAIESGWVSGFNSSAEARNQTLTVTYTENDVTKTATYNVNIADQVKAIEVTSQPTKKEYGWGEELDLTGAKLKVTYGSGDQTIDITRDMITNYNKEQTGAQDLVVSYQGKTATVTVDVTVVDKLVSIAMETNPQQEYKINGALNRNGTILITRQSGATESKSLGDSGVTITGFDSSVEVKNQRLTVTYKETYSESFETAETFYDINVIDKITAITVSTMPKTEYNYGDIFTTTGGKVTLTKESGATEVIDLSECNLEGYRATELGNQTINVTYTRDGVTKGCTYQVKVNDYVDRIVVTAPTKIDYGYGDALVLDGGSVTKIMASGAQTTVDLTDAAVTIPNKDTITKQIGTVPVTVEYAGKTTTFNITITDEIESVTLVNDIKKEYKFGESFDANGAYYVIKSKANPNGSEKQITSNMVTGFDSSTLTESEPSGSRTLTINVVEGYSFNYQYTVNDYVTGIELVAPTKTRYSYTNNTDAKLDITGGSVKKIMASGADVLAIGLSATGVTYTEYIPNKLGKQTITVSYANFEKQFTVDVRDELVSIELVGTPKQNYIYGDSFDANGAQVKVNYLSKSETIELTNDMVQSDFYTSGSNALTNGTPRTATVSYSYADGDDPIKTSTATFTYTVADQVEDIVLTEPIKKSYYYGLLDSLDLAGGTVQKIMKSGIIQPIVSLDNSDVEVTGYIARPSNLGNQTITVKYAGITKTFEIEVKDRLEGISITDLPEQVYYVGDSIKLTDAKLNIDRLKNDETNPLSNYTIDDFSTATPTAQGQRRTASVTIEEDGISKTATFNYEVKDFVKEVTLVAPRKSEYYLYDDSSKFDLSGGYLTITMASGIPASNIELTDSNVTVTGFNTNSVGEKTIEVSYTNEKGETLVAGTFKIKVYDQIKKVTLVGAPKSHYLYGDSIDLQGATLTVEKISGTTENVVIDVENDITGFATNSLTNGTARTATITYTENNTFLKILDEANKVTFDYEVEEYISGITNIQEPTKLVYYLNDADSEFNLDGGYIEISKASGATSEQVALSDSRVTVTGFDTTSIGTKTITVEYTNEKGAVFSKEFEILVKDRLEGVALVGTPKTAYKFGESLDLNGTKLKVSKLSGDTIVSITDEMMSGFTSTQLTAEGHSRTVTIKYVFDGVEKTASFDYTVEDYISAVRLNEPSDKTYYLGEELDLSDASLSITMASATPVADIALTDSTVSVTGYNKDELGIQTITVAYEGFDNTFDVEVKDRLESVALVGTPKTAYKFGEELELNGAKLGITKLSGYQEITITEDMISGFTSTQLTAEGTTRDATISYTFDGVTKTDKFEYTVEDYIIGATLVAPSKVEYNYGSNLDLTDSYFRITMKSGNSAEDVYLTDSRVTITGYNKNQLGAQTVTAEYAGFSSDFGVVVVDKVKEVTFTIDSIAAKDYKYGSSLDLSNATALVENLSGETNTVQINNSMISGYNPTILGKQEITVNVEGFIKKIEVNVIDYVTGIELTAPNKALYIVKEELDLTGGSLKVTMASGAQEIKPLTSSMISGYDKTKLGNQTVKVTYEGFNKNFVVQVVDKLAEVRMESLPKTQYKYGESLDLTGAKLRITNESDAYEIIDVTSSMVSGYNPNKLGEQIITVTYDNGEETKTTTFPVMVEDYVKEIEFTKPEKTEYRYGEELDLTGAKFTEILASGKVNKVVYVTPEMVTKFNNKVVGKQTLTAMYGDTPGEFQVSVIDDILSMAINSLPNKVEYIKGESIELAGGKITIIKDSGVYNFDITSDMISGFDPNKVGAQIITVKYQGLETQLTVVVKEVEVEEEKPVKPTRPKRPTKPVSNSTESNIEDVIGGIEDNISEEDTNSNASENKDKENNNDINKDVTLGEKGENADANNEANSSTIIKTVTVSGLGIVALVALVFILKRKNNVKVYEEDEDELILVGKERLDEDEKVINISKYVENAPDKNIVVILDKNISKKLDKETLKIKLDSEELETIVEYEDGEFEIKIEK